MFKLSDARRVQHQSVCTGNVRETLAETETDPEVAKTRHKNGHHTIEILCFIFANFNEQFFFVAKLA